MKRKKLVPCSDTKGINEKRTALLIEKALRHLNLMIQSENNEALESTVKKRDIQFITQLLLLQLIWLKHKPVYKLVCRRHHQRVFLG